MENLQNFPLPVPPNEKSVYEDLLALYKRSSQKQQQSVSNNTDNVELANLNRKFDQAQMQDTIRSEFRNIQNQLRADMYQTFSPHGQLGQLAQPPQQIQQPQQPQQQVPQFQQAQSQPIQSHIPSSTTFSVDKSKNYQEEDDDNGDVVSPLSKKKLENYKFDGYFDDDDFGFNDEREKLENDLVRVRQENERLKSENERLKNENENSKFQLDELRNTEAMETDETDRMNDKIKDLEQKLNVSEAEAKEAKNRLRDSETTESDKISELKKVNKQLDQQIQQLDQQLLRSRQESSKISELELKNQEFVQEKQDFVQKTQALERQVQDKERQIKTLEQDISQVKSERDTIRTKQSENETREQDLVRDLNETRTELNQAKRTIESMVSEKNMQDLEKNTWTALNGQLKLENGQLKLENGQLAAKFNNIEAELDRVKSDQLKTMASLDKQLLQNRELRKELQNLNVRQAVLHDRPPKRKAPEAPKRKAPDTGSDIKSISSQDTGTLRVKRKAPNPNIDNVDVMDVDEKPVDTQMEISQEQPAVQPAVQPAIQPSHTIEQCKTIINNSLEIVKGNVTETVLKNATKAQTGHTASFWLANYCAALYLIKLKVAGDPAVVLVPNNSFVYGSFRATILNILADKISQDQKFANNAEWMKKVLVKANFNSKFDLNTWQKNFLIELAFKFDCNKSTEQLTWYYVKEQQAAPGALVSLDMSNCDSDEKVEIIFARNDAQTNAFTLFAPRKESGCASLWRDFIDLAKLSVQYANHNFKIKEKDVRVEYSNTSLDMANFLEFVESARKIFKK